MYFNRDFYLGYIKKREFTNAILYTFLFLVAVATGYFLNFNLKITPAIAYTIPIIISFIVDYFFYLRLQIQLEEMKMRLDIYNKIMQEKNEE